MRLEPLKDEGQLLPQLRGMLIGVLDTEEQLDAAVADVNAAGVSNSEMFVLHGEDGLNLIERFQDDAAYFSDGPEKLFNRDKSVLAEGKYVLGIDARNRDHARELADLMQQHGGHGIAYFGKFVDTLFS